MLQCPSDQASVHSSVNLGLLTSHMAWSQHFKCRLNFRNSLFVSLAQTSSLQTALKHTQTWVSHRCSKLRWNIKLWSFSQNSSFSSFQLLVILLVVPQVLPHIHPLEYSFCSTCNRCLTSNHFYHLFPHHVNPFFSPLFCFSLLLFSPFFYPSLAPSRSLSFAPCFLFSFCAENQAQVLTCYWATAPGLSFWSEQPSFLDCYPVAF